MSQPVKSECAWCSRPNCYGEREACAEREANAAGYDYHSGLSFRKELSFYPGQDLVETKSTKSVWGQ